MTTNLPSLPLVAKKAPAKKVAAAKVPAKKAPAARKPRVKEVIPPLRPTVPIEERKRLIAELADEAKEALAQAIMDFQEPDICASGRKKFLAEFGLPAQPERMKVTITVTARVHPDSLIKTGYEQGMMSVTGKATLTRSISDALQPLGMAVTDVHARTTGR